MRQLQAHKGHRAATSPTTSAVWGAVTRRQRDDRITANESLQDEANAASRHVSVVIPTIGRETLRAAVESALGQTHPPLEVIVAADTDLPLPLPMDDRVRVIRVGPGAGGNVARNAAIAMATGDLLALLDDDDTWHPNKIQVQLSAVRSAGISDAVPWIASSRVRVVYADGRAPEIWPKMMIRDQDSVPEYVTRKRRVRGGLGFMQASTLLVPTVLARQVPFDVNAPFHQDLQWLIDLDAAFPDLPVVQSPEPLVDYYVRSGSVSHRISAAQSASWAETHLVNVTPRARGDFLMTSPVTLARRQGDVRAILRSMFSAWRLGRPGLPSQLFAAASLFVAATARAREACTRRGPHSHEGEAVRE